jgi:ribonuclease J
MNNDVQLTILRGAESIGGSCVKIEFHGEALLFDYGMPLMKSGGEPLLGDDICNPTIQNGILLDKAIFDKANPLAFLISHAHPDHYGLIDYLPESTPVYLSSESIATCEITNIFYPEHLKIKRLDKCKPYEANKMLHIGPFCITPYLMDHSAFGAHSFLIQVGGKTLFYSGDFRGHGRKPWLKKQFDQIDVAIDVMLMEGTTLDSRHGKRYESELEVELAITEKLKQHSNPTFVAASGSNIDRLVSLYNACKRSGRYLVLDLYQMYLLEKLKIFSSGLPPHDGDHIRVFFPYSQLQTVKKHLGEDFFRYKKRHVNIEKINKDYGKYVFRLSNHLIFDLIDEAQANGYQADLIYSMWSGYLEQQPKFKEIAKIAGSEWHEIHTSGHAYRNYLQELVALLKPKTLIPIHTLERDKFPKYFPNVTKLDDGEPFVIK